MQRKYWYFHSAPATWHTRMPNGGTCVLRKHTPLALFTSAQRQHKNADNRRRWEGDEALIESGIDIICPVHSGCSICWWRFRFTTVAAAIIVIIIIITTELIAVPSACSGGKGVKDSLPRLRICVPVVVLLSGAKEKENTASGVHFGMKSICYTRLALVQRVNNGSPRTIRSTIYSEQ